MSNSRHKLKKVIIRHLSNIKLSKSQFSPHVVWHIYNSTGFLLKYAKQFVIVDNVFTK